MLGHKVSLWKLEKIKIISSVFPDHRAMRWEINYKKIKNTKHMAAKQYATEQPMDHWRNQSGNKKIPRPMGKKHNDPKSMECRKSSSKREVYSNTILPHKTKKISNKQPNIVTNITREKW